MSNTGAAKRRSKMRFETFNAFVDESLAKLTPSEVRVWIILFRDGKPPRWEARASLDDIARRAGISRQTVWRAVKTLERRGMLRAVRRGGLNTGPGVRVVAPYPVKWE